MTVDTRMMRESDENRKRYFKLHSNKFEKYLAVITRYPFKCALPKCKTVNFMKIIFHFENSQPILHKNCKKFEKIADKLKILTIPFYCLSI